MKRYVLFAGVNGAGKTTLFQNGVSRLWKNELVYYYIGIEEYIEDYADTVGKIL